MQKAPSLISDPKAYGSKGQNWHPDFVAYMVSIVRHPNFKDMPDVTNADGKIQWEAPSNRGSGQFQNTHHKRRDWWRQRAKLLGIDTSKDQWISRTAKTNHPTGRKPCKRCGRVMRIAYAYPNANLARKFLKVFGTAPNKHEEIGSFIERIWAELGSASSERLAQALSTSDIKAPVFRSLKEWLNWTENTYIPSEPSLLSPGAMSNAPDRLDGFHSFNLCCRKRADTGRHDANMKTYLTDRRVFEFWSDGDWISADRLMAEVGAKFRNHKSQDGKVEISTADHVGPLSLGFCHRPEFLLLSRAANSAKNNRMRLWDVKHLIKTEGEGEVVASWYAKPIWDLLKKHVDSEETALRLSKIMRDNQRYAMLLLFQSLKQGYVGFLLSLLQLGYADFSPSFVNLRVDAHLTRFDLIRKTRRTTKYSIEQKARRARIAFTTLVEYGSKLNRHGFNILNNDDVKRLSKNMWSILDQETKAIDEINDNLRKHLLPALANKDEDKIREVIAGLPDDLSQRFRGTRHSLKLLMKSVGEQLAAQWKSDRYLRAEFSFE